MSGFRDCIMSAREQGVLDKEEADDLIARYERHRRARATAGDLDPHEAAKLGLAGELDAEGTRQKYLAKLAADKRDEILADLTKYRDAKGRPDIYEAAMRKLENFGFSGFSSVRGQALARTSLTHGEMADVLKTFERNTITGFHHAKPAARDVVREILGETTGNTEAAAMAKSVSGAFERLRQEFNAAGGDIGTIDGGYIPQYHNPLAVRRAGFDKWRAYLGERLAPERIKDPLTGDPISAPRLDEAMKVAYDRITTGGWNEREPQASPFGRGALANQRAEARFFVFKDAASWLDYDSQFGHGDPMKAIFQHINGMNRDIAALDVLGPNPSSTVEWMKQVVESEHGKALTGADSDFHLSNWTDQGEQDAGKKAAKHIEDLWQNVRGRGVISTTLSKAFGDIRNVLTSAQLGGAAVTAAMTDPAIDRAARMALGMPDTWLFGANAKTYLDAVSNLFHASVLARPLATVIDRMTGMPREHAARSGMIVEQFLHILGDEARYAGTLGGNVWSRWLAERTINASGLGPITDARRAVFHLDFQAFLGDMAGKDFAGLPDRLRAKMEGYGFDAKSWDTMRAVEQTDGLLRPVDVAQKDRALAGRYLEMILGETERGIPTTNMRAKALITGGAPRGTWAQELLDSFLQYKSFGLSLVTLQAEAIAHETANMGRARGASYAAQLFILTTIGGALTLQLKNMANGKDPQNVRDVKFWTAAMATGGGMGIYGDFLFNDVSSGGASFLQQATGPVGAAATDVAKVTLGNLQELWQGKDTHAGAEAAKFAARYTPLASSLWYTRLAYQRELMDQLQYLVDPKAARSWREQERKVMRDKGQGFWWHPGDAAPARMPAITGQ